MERLWSPWRLEYVSGNKKDAGCVFCLGDTDSPEETARRHERRSLIVF